MFNSLGRNTSRFTNASIRMYSSQPGSGGSGSIREAGGAFSDMGKAKEEQYFHNLQKEQLKKMHDHLHNEIKNHKKQAEEHHAAIKRNEEKLKELEAAVKDFKK
uniref:ATPase inhibitor, mitochondrial n=1 Tax=Parastrongyloides trichosuri TaxID=131310 RepID=A0A0N4ZPG0_PARTI